MPPAVVVLSGWANMAEVDRKTKEEFQNEIEGLESKQKEITKFVEVHEKLQAQLNENKIVKEELDFLEEGAKVYKQTGPVLVKQDLDEAKAAIGNRISYISAEIERKEKVIAELQKGQDAHKEKLKLIQSRLTPPQAAVKA